VKRDIYAEVSARIVAELERGALPWIKPWSATAGQNVPQNAVSNRPYSGTNVVLLWLARDRGWPTPRFLTFKQAQEAGGSVRKGERGTKVYFVKQLRVTETKEGEALEKLVPMLREYCVFNVAQCKGLPASIVEGKPARVRNPDGRDPLADEFLASSGQSSARVQARLTMRQGKTSSACPPSLPSKAQTISTALPSTNLLIGEATRQGLTET